VSPREEAFNAAKKLPPPSSYAKSQGIESYTQDKTPINHHRLAACSDMPIEFYHDIFATFREQLGKEDEHFVHCQDMVEQLVPRILQPMENEHERRLLFLRFLRSLKLPLEPIDHGPMRSDGTLFTSGIRKFLLCNLEVKSSGCDAYMQNVAYYSKLTGQLGEENRDVAASTCFPSFLITLEGISISVQLFLYIFTCNKCH
jgi:hypothetical protein